MATLVSMNPDGADTTSSKGRERLSTPYVVALVLSGAVSWFLGAISPFAGMVAAGSCTDGCARAERLAALMTLSGVASPFIFVLAAILVTRLRSNKHKNAALALSFLAPLMFSVFFNMTQTALVKAEQGYFSRPKDPAKDGSYWAPDMARRSTDREIAAARDVLRDAALVAGFSASEVQALEFVEPAAVQFGPSSGMGAAVCSSFSRSLTAVRVVGTLPSRAVDNEFRDAVEVRLNDSGWTTVSTTGYKPLKGFAYWMNDIATTQVESNLIVAETSSPEAFAEERVRVWLLFSPDKTALLTETLCVPQP